MRVVALKSKRWFRSRTPPTTRDARGRSVPLAPAPVMGEVRHLDRATAKRITDQLSNKSLSPRVLMWLLGAAGVLVALGDALNAVTWRQWMSLVVRAGFYPCLGVSIYVASVNKDCKKRRAAYLEAKHCASCAYDLAGLPTADDSCLECPECGAAWKLGVGEPD